MVFGLDHILSEQEAASEEIAAIREWLKREGCQQSNRSLHRRNGNWKTASRDRRPKPAPHGPKYQKLPTRD
jgi:hypothetical protein